MLSRIAESLFWLSRYIERAEYTARILDVNFHTLLEQSKDRYRLRWEPLIVMAGGGGGVPPSSPKAGARAAVGIFPFPQDHPPRLQPSRPQTRGEARTHCDRHFPRMWG